MRTPLFFVAGILVFVVITFFEQLPVVGWLGGVVSIGTWIALAREYASNDRDLLRSGAGVAWVGALGAVTGFVGALTAWLAQTGNLFGFTTAPGDRFGAAFGFVGASFGLLYWPVIGVLVCAVAAVATTPRR